MKKALLSVLLAAAMLALALPAAADVIFEPENAFYEKHRDECEYEDRTYETAGYDGSVTVWDAPNGTVLSEQPNGDRFPVLYRWHGKTEDWGYIESLDGWVPMDDLSLVYDSRQFMLDHDAEIVTGDPAPVDFDSAVLYRYPGGPAGGTLQEDEDYLPFSELFTTLYTDESGLRWGYVSYYMGHVNAWVCLDDAQNEHLDTNAIPTEPSAAQQRGAPTVTPRPHQRMPWLLAGALVLLAAGVTFILIHKTRAKK